MGWTFEGYDGREYRLGRKRYHQHILPAHGEMDGRIEDIRRTVEEPERAAESRQDDAVRLLYRDLGEEPNAYICVVVHTTEKFVITAYMTDRPKPHASAIS